MKDQILELIEDYKRKVKYCDELICEAHISSTVHRVNGKKEAYKGFILDLERRTAMNNEPTITELPKMLKEYEKRHNLDHVKVSIFSDQSGDLLRWYYYSCDEKIFEFESIPELIEKLKS